MKNTAITLLTLTLFITFCSQTNAQIKYSTYNGKTYSIDYPSEWGVVEKPDYISDVIIASKTEFIAFTVTYAETDISLTDFVNEDITERKANGIKMLGKTTSITLCGVPCYKYKMRMAEYTLYSYLLKKNGIIFQIQFGNTEEALTKNKPIVERVIKSFKIKNGDSAATNTQSKQTPTNIQDIVDDSQELQARRFQAAIRGMKDIDRDHSGSMAIGNLVAGSKYGESASNDELSQINWDEVANSDNPQELIDKRIIEIRRHEYERNMRLFFKFALPIIILIIVAIVAANSKKWENINKQDKI